MQAKNSAEVPRTGQAFLYALVPAVEIQCGSRIVLDHETWPIVEVRGAVTDGQVVHLHLANGGVIEAPCKSLIEVAS